ncbi:MAG: hypothetical protein EXQ55_06115 [Acidobacteria bacterium]|nr:hypothetical protein [Acidobacteriota bacterium]
MYRSGSACSDVKNGIKVTLEGVPGSDGKVLASKVVVEKPAERTLKGYVGSFAGVCPSPTFTVNSTATTTGATTGKASTNGSTKFSPGGCSDLKNGFSVVVEGTVVEGITGSEGRVLARVVTVTATAPK